MLPWEPRNIKRTTELVIGWDKLAPLGSLEDVVVSAAFTAATWRRREQVRREIGLTAAQMGTSLPEAMVRWSASCLRVRVPTTVLSYWHVAVAEILGSTKLCTLRQRQWHRGLLALYGSTAWFTRQPPMVMETARATVADETFPEWFRVHLDVCWHAVGRVADLQYLTPSDVELDDDAASVTCYFTFLKNDVDGSLGSVKTLRVWNYPLVRQYVRRMAGSIQVFPQSAREVNLHLQRLGHRSRDIRRGGALLLTENGGLEADIAQQLAHRSTATQRTYTQRANSHRTTQLSYLQDILSGTHAPVRSAIIAGHGPETSSIEIPTRISPSCSIGAMAFRDEASIGAENSSPYGSALVAWALQAAAPTGEV